MAPAHQGTHHHNIHAVLSASHDAQLSDVVSPIPNPNYPAPIVSLPTSSRGTSSTEDGPSNNNRHPSSNKFELPIKPELLSRHAVRYRQGEGAVGTCVGREMELGKVLGGRFLAKGLLNKVSCLTCFAIMLTIM
jgi:hypothetical protein